MRGGVEEEGECQADPTLSAEPDVRLDPVTLRSRPEPKSRAGLLTDGATPVPEFYSLSTF